MTTYIHWVVHIGRREVTTYIHWEVHIGEEGGDHIHTLGGSHWEGGK